LETNNTNIGWYAQSYETEQAAEMTAPAETPKKKKKKVRRFFIILLIAAVVVSLLLGSIRLFADRGAAQKDAEGLPAENVPSGNSGTGNGSTQFPFGGFDSFDDYYDYYSSQSSSASAHEASNLPRAETGTGVKVVLESCEGKKLKTLQELYTDCVNSVVGIYATVDGKLGYYWGTGIIMTEDGYILTNQHIIAGTDTAGVLLPDGTECPAKLVGEDDDSDIAVLKIEAAGLQAAVFGDSSELSVGDPVAAIGNPLMTNLSDTLTNGIVSGIERSVDNNGQTMTLIQTNTALNEGNSGGPLFNMYGQVVGITNMKINAGTGEVTVEGIGFAIPTTTVRTVANRLIEKGEYVRPGIGITVRQFSDAELAGLGLENGLSVEGVSKGCDAEKKGVKVGDIITAVDGRAVSTTAEVLAIRDEHDIGEDIVLTILRDGKTLEIAITLVVYDTLY